MANNAMLNIDINDLNKFFTKIIKRITVAKPKMFH